MGPRIIIVGESDDPDDSLEPWGRAGAILERAIRRAGFNRTQFTVLEKADTQAIHEMEPRAVLALGGRAIANLTGLSGPKLGVSQLAGYVLPSYDNINLPVVASFHPGYLRQGHMGLFGVLMRTIRQVITCSKGQKAIVPEPSQPPKGYHIKADEYHAADFKAAVKSGNWPYLAYDIETHYSVDEEEAEEHEGEIKSIQFSLASSTGVFWPWREPYIGIAKDILALPIPKLSWNGWRFDEPRLKKAGLLIHGDNHDLMWAWHQLQPDLPRSLQFAAGQLGWPWPWKHLSGAYEAFYGIVDVDVLQWMVKD